MFRYSFCLKAERRFLMDNHEIKIIYPKGMRVTLKGTTFRKAVQIALANNNAVPDEPLKMIFLSTGKILFLDKNAFSSYLNGTITQKELIELTECDELYRNNNDMQINDHYIDKGSLWKGVKQQAILIDDDVYVFTKLDLNIFEAVEPLQ